MDGGPGRGASAMLGSSDGPGARSSNPGRGATGAVLGFRRPAVQVLVTDADLRARRGLGHLEGQTAPVSINTVERIICDAGTVPIHFDTDGQVVNVGRDHRLFTHRQRIGLAARDGGCRFPGCERPPSWTEAHHIRPWHSEAGRTDIADGILLCRHHHLLVHNNGWRIARTDAEYFVIPPRSLDAAQRPIPAPSRSAPARRLAAATATPTSPAGPALATASAG